MVPGGNWDAPRAAGVACGPIPLQLELTDVSVEGFCFVPVSPVHQSQAGRGSEKPGIAEGVPCL